MSRIVSESVNNVMGPFGTLAAMAANTACPVVLPIPGEILDLYASQKCTYEQLKLWLRQAGIYIGPREGGKNVAPQSYLDQAEVEWAKVIDGRFDWPDWPDLVTLSYMGLADNTDLLNSLRRKRMPENWARIMLATVPMVPPPSDLLRYVVRDNFSIDVVKQFGYTEEFDSVQSSVGKYVSRYGYTQPVNIPGYGQDGLPPFTWLLAEWMSHWTLPSPGQGYEMLHRLRKVNGISRDPSGETFEQKDLDLLLKTLDYPPYWRRKLSAISFKPLQIRTVQVMGRAGILTPEQAVQYLQDGGYNARDAQLLGTYLANANRLTQTQTERRAAQRAVVSQYQLGLLARDDAAVHFYRLSLDTADQLAAFEANPPAAQLALATADRLTQTTLDRADLQTAAGDTKASIAAVRKLYVSDTIDWPIADRYLTQLGVVGPARDRYRSLWGWASITKAKNMSPSQVLKYVSMGLVDPSWARQQLLLVGLPSDQIDVLIADAQLTRIGRQGKALAALAKDYDGRQKLLQQRAKAAQQIAKQAQAELAKSASPATLERWLASGVITPQQYLARVTQIGMSPADAQRVLVYEQQQADRKAAKAAQAAAKPPTPSSPQGRPGVSRSVLTQWLKKGIIQEAEFRDRMAALGFSAENVQKFVTQFSPK